MEAADIPNNERLTFACEALRNESHRRRPGACSTSLQKDSNTKVCHIMFKSSCGLVCYTLHQVFCRLSPGIFSIFAQNFILKPEGFPPLRISIKRSLPSLATSHRSSAGLRPIKWLKRWITLIPFVVTVLFSVLFNGHIKTYYEYSATLLRWYLLKVQF